MPPTEHVKKRAPAANGEAGAPGEATSRDWAERCANCGAALHGAYCHDCGEKAVTADDYALSTFLRKGLATLTHLDGSAFRTYYSLLARPGFLTQEHRAGRRTRYLRPLQVFLIVNVVYFFFVTWTGSMTFLRPTLEAHLHGDFYSGVAARLVEAHRQQQGLAMEAYAARFDRWVVSLSKTLIITMIPVFALLLKLFYVRRRRYYVEHLIFSCHFYAFFLVLQMVLLPALILVGMGVSVFSMETALFLKDAIGNGLGFVLMLASIIGVYLCAALRRRYEQAAWLTALKGVALAAGVVGIMQLYDALLFFVAFYATT